MFFNREISAENDYNECVARGNCATSPEIRAIQEVIFTFIRQLAFYELKHEELNISYFENKETLINGVITLISTGEYTREQLLEIISKIYSKLIYARKEYLNFCTENNLKCDDIKLGLKLSPEMTLNEIINSGEKTFLERYKKISPAVRTIHEILILVIKSICTNLIKLKEFGKFDDTAYKNILTGLNSLNFRRTTVQKIKDMIDRLSKTDMELVRLLASAQKEKFGSFLEKIVSLSTKPAKAILVSGANMQNLYDVLKLSENLDIDVYTHADLLIAHTFEKFQRFKNLKGHYGTCFSNCIVDFATFPGSILLTKNTFPNIDYLYRGKLFSGEDMPPQGVVQIKDNDYTELIEAAFNSKGFTKGREVAPVMAGYDEELLDAKLSEICRKFNGFEISNLVIIGISDYSGVQDEYFRKLFKLLASDTFVITFSHHSKRENELFINLVNNLPAVSSIMSKIFEKIDIKSERISFFLTRCDANSVSNMINLHNAGASKIFLTECPPYVINPNIQSTLKNMYGINIVSTPKNDVEIIYN